ncbi:hypothetical protein [Actinomadura xylanilytica]|uniref:hypothetical protein n=1 Tax=Actinomadura xylanilytica TaxID=887459 RepID=UPI00255A9BA9|nr:hypothetical protein [Actinomadura xylanilytica]MDL4773615.1 hypothetical protein [Actinomadura xylanilytica]
MKRVATTLGTLAVAGTLTLAAPGTASAAHGELVFGGGQVVHNPSGCIKAQTRPLILQNRTNEYALIFSSPNCTREMLAVVPPGGRTVQERGSSVYVA